MAHIVILGAGVGGIPCAYDLRKSLGKEHRITLVGSSPFFEFTPSNPWIAVGWRKPEQVRVEMHDPLESRGIQWLPSPATKIDAPSNTMTLASGQVVNYDYLVITTGPKLSFDEVPGLGPAGHTHSVCTHAHSLSAWDAYLALCRAGGSKGYFELLALAGLDVPFAEGSVERAVCHVIDELNA